MSQADPGPAEAQDLIALLGQIQGLVESLAHEEHLKTQAIAARNLEALADITERQESLSLKLAAFELERQELVRACDPGAPIDPTVQQLADSIGGAVGTRLRIAGQELVNTVAQLRAAAHANAGTLQWAAELTRAVAQWLLGYGQTVPGYTRSGSLQADQLLSARDWRA